MRLRLTGTLLALLVIAAFPSPASAATCADYPNQAAAQQAADTRDADGDGIYCESLPCPCSTQSGGSPTPPPTQPRRTCARPRVVVRLGWLAARYPNIRSHALGAIRRGWPTVLVVNRPGASARRERLLRGIPTRPGFDRDEYPPAVGRGRGPGLTRGVHPIGWMADVRYVPSAENRSHGSSLGSKLRRYCNGTRFRYVFS
jgi:hypothetical protein